MALLLNVVTVQYKCSCGKWSPLSKQYFCRHCLVLRCSFCVCHEVDSIYCTQCLENMPIAEARLKRNRCGNCIDCPLCGHSVSTRATSASGALTADESASGTPRKVYYLTCAFCQWSSRHAGIADQAAASGPWPEHENKNSAVVSAIIEKFRVLAAIEKTERERRRLTPKKGSFLPIFSDKYGLTSLLTKKRLGIPITDPSKGASTEFATDFTSGTEAVEDVDDLPDFLFTESLQLERISTLEQRYSHPELQSELLNEFYPVRKQLIAKRSQRCKVCEHNLCKGEFNPSSIKFKIQLCALFHVPEVRLLSKPSLIPNSSVDICLTLCNLAASKTHITLLPVGGIMEHNVTGLESATPEITLPVRDDTAEYGEEPASHEQFNDDPRLVIFRKRHKVGIKIQIKTPEQLAGDLWLSFIVKYDYVNTLLHLTGEQSEPEISFLQQCVKVNLGPVLQ